MGSCTPCSKSKYIVPTDISTDCLNPLIYLLEPALIASNGDLTVLNESVEALLADGLYLQNKNNLCCPDCIGDDSFYFLGDSTSFGLFITSYSASNNFSNVLNCCANFLGDLTSSGSIKLLLGDTFSNDIECCNNSFSDTLKNYISTLSLLVEVNNEGLIEISTFGNNSFLPVLKNKILEIYPYADDVFLRSVLSNILTSGVFIKCTDCGILITNAESSGTALDNFIE